MRKRTINCPENLSRQLALIAAEWGCSSETVIQSLLAAGIATVAQHDKALRLALARGKRETIINMDDDRELATIYTCQRTLITKLRKNPSAVEMQSGVFDGTPWATFQIPAELITFRTGHRTVTAETRAKLLANITKARLARATPIPV